MIDVRGNVTGARYRSPNPQDPTAPVPWSPIVSDVTLGLFFRQGMGPIYTVDSADATFTYIADTSDASFRGDLTAERQGTYVHSYWVEAQGLDSYNNPVTGVKDTASIVIRSPSQNSPE